MRYVSCRHAVRGARVGLALAGCLLAAACARQPAPELAGDELFSLSLGPLDEQLDLFRVGGAPPRGTTRISMRDGLFYVANGSARKVMQLSSYGDLLLLIYDPAGNPAPLGMTAAAGTRLAVPHALRDPGHVAVDSQQRIYVVDAAAGEGGEAGEIGAGYGQVVQRFGARGRHLGTIGREGEGGTPFARIRRLTVTADDLLVVTVRTPRQWLCYWYDAAGQLLEQVELPYGGPFGGEERLLVWEVLPQVAARRLLLFVDAWPAQPGAGNAAAVRDAPGVRVYDLASHGVVGSYALPASGSRRSAVAGAAEQPAPAYYPLGVTAGGRLFLTRREDERTHSLVVLGRGGREVTRRRFALDEAGLGFVTLGMNARGVLYGLLAGEARARVVWWRSDLLLEQAAQGGGG